MFSKKLSIYIPIVYVSRKTPGNAEGTHGLWGTIVCTTKYIIYIYSQTGTFIYPEPPNTHKKLLKL